VDAVKTVNAKIASVTKRLNVAIVVLVKYTYHYHNPLYTQT